MIHLLVSPVWDIYTRLVYMGSPFPADRIYYRWSHVLTYKSLVVTLSAASNNAIPSKVRLRVDFALKTEGLPSIDLPDEHKKK